MSHAPETGIISPGDNAQDSTELPEFRPSSLSKEFDGASSKAAKAYFARRYLI